MDSLEKCVQEELKDRIKYFELCEKLAYRYARKYGKNDNEKAAYVIDLSMAFFVNMVFRFLNPTANKKEYLGMIETANNALQRAFTEVLNDTFAPKRKFQA